MKKNSKKIATTVVAAIFLWLLYVSIFSLSAQNAEESNSLSHMISLKCVEIVDYIVGGEWNVNHREKLASYWEHPIRKAAHFTEYAVMGVLLYGVWGPWKKPNRKFFLFLIGWILISAALDEFHQTFIPGRYGCLPDVLLDTLGGSFGLLVVNKVCAFFKDPSS